MCARVRKQRTSDSGLIWKGAHIIMQPPRGVGRGPYRQLPRLEKKGTTFALARSGLTASPRFRGVSCQTPTAVNGPGRFGGCPRYGPNAGRRGQKCGVDPTLCGFSGGR